MGLKNKVKKSVVRLTKHVVGQPHVRQRLESGLPGLASLPRESHQSHAVPKVVLEPAAFDTFSHNTYTVTILFSMIFI